MASSLAPRKEAKEIAMQTGRQRRGKEKGGRERGSGKIGRGVKSFILQI